MQSKRVAVQTVINVSEELNYTGPAYEKAVNRGGILIVLSHYEKKDENEVNYNPFPNVGSVLIDYEAKKPDIICK